MSNENIAVHRANVLFREVKRLTALVTEKELHGATEIAKLRNQVVGVQEKLSESETKIVTTIQALRGYVKREASLKKKITHLNNTLKEQAGENTITQKVLTERIKELDAELLAEKGKLDMARTEMEQLRGQYRELFGENQKSTQKFTTQLKLRERELVEARNQIEDLRQKINQTLEKAEIKHQTKVSALQAQYEGRLSEIETSLKEKEKQIEQERQKHMKVLEREREYVTEIALRGQINDELQNKVEQLQSELQSSQVVSQGYKEKVAEKSEQLEQQSVKTATLANEKEELRAAVAGLEGDIRKLQVIHDEVAELKEERDNALEAIQNTKRILEQQAEKHEIGKQQSLKREQTLTEQLTVEMQKVETLKGQINWLKNSPAISSLGSTTEGMPDMAVERFLRGEAAVDTSAANDGWNIQNRTLVSRVAVVGLIAIFTVYFMTLPNPASQMMVDNNNVVQGKITHQPPLTNSSTSNRPAQVVAARGDGTIGKPSIGELRTVNIPTTGERIRTFSLPEWLIDSAISESVAQENRDVYEQAGIDYSVLNSSIRIADTAGRQYEAKERDAPAFDEYLESLVREGRITPEEYKQLAYLSTQQPEGAKVSLKRAVEFSASPTGQRISKSEEEDVALTYYGELLNYTKQQRDERAGRVPHSRGAGGRIGRPAPSRDTRIGEFQDSKLNDPDTIIKFRAAQDSKEEALNASIPVDHRIRTINYAESKIPVVKLAKGNIITLAFLDKFGNPYPVVDVSPREGNGLMTASIKGAESQVVSGNIVELRGLKLAGTTTLSVLLADRVTPTSFQVQMTADTNDTKTTVMMPKAAPGYENLTLAEPKYDDKLCKDDVLIENVLHGVFPKALQRIEVGTNSMQVYASPGHAYIRSYHEITAPSCDCLVYDAEQLNVCRVSTTEPLVEYMDNKAKAMQRLNLASLIDEERG